MQDIVAANFIGSKNAGQQIAMLFLLASGPTGGDEYGLTLIGTLVPDATVISSTTVLSYDGRCPTICTPDVFDNGIKLTYDKSEFTFSDPTVLAVLAATPYYAGLPYEAAQGNVGTSFGTGSGIESTKSEGLEASIGVKFGFQQNINAFVKITDFQLLFSLEDSFTANYSYSESIEKNISFSNYVGKADKSANSVVVAAVPEDIYYYKVDDEASSESTEVEIVMPYAPETSIIPLTDYDSIVKNDNNAPYIKPKEVLHGIQPGNPASYPSSTNVRLSNIGGSSVVRGSKFIECGLGNNSAQQTVDLSSSNSTSVSNTVSVGVEVQGNVGGLVLGGSGSVGRTTGHENATSNSTTIEGSVAAVPEGYEQYQFQWELMAYNYKITAGSSTQEIVVVSYLVPPLLEAMPPVQPQDFRVGSVSAASATLKWDPVDKAVGYHVLRSSTISGTYKVIGTTGTVKWKDTSVQPDQTYYYKVEAYDGSPEVDGQAAGPLPVQTPGALTLQVDFKVGTRDQAKLLVPNQLLVAQATIKNNQETAQNVIFIVTLYNGNGAMVSQSHEAVSIAGMGTCNAQARFVLPENVTNDTLAAFLWEGSDLASSSLVPLSKVVKITS